MEAAWGYVRRRPTRPALHPLLETRDHQNLPPRNCKLSHSQCKDLCFRTAVSGGLYNEGAHTTAHREGIGVVRLGLRWASLNARRTSIGEFHRADAGEVDSGSLGHQPRVDKDVRWDVLGGTCRFETLHSAIAAAGVGGKICKDVVALRPCGKNSCGDNHSKFGVVEEHFECGGREHSTDYG